MPAMVRESWPDIGRGFAIVTIVFFHVAQALDVIGDVHWKIWVLIQMFAPIPIALFFFVSGLFSRKFVEGPWSGGLRSRLVGFLYVFVVWSLIETAVRSGLTGTFPKINALAYLLNPVSVLWFVWALILFTALAKFCFQNLWLPLLVVSAVLSVISFAGIVSIDSFVHENLVRYAIFFLLGVSVKDFRSLSVFQGFLPFLVGAACYGGLSVWIFNTESDLAKGLLFGLLTWISIPTAIAGCYLLSKVRAIEWPMAWLGRNSLGVYLGHPVAIMLLVAVYERTFHQPESPAFGAVFILMGFGILCSIAVFVLASRTNIKALYHPPRRVAA